MNDIHYTVEFTLKQDARDRFESLAEECISRVRRDEPNTLGYEWYITADGSKCHIDEWFKDSDAMLEHLGGSVVTEVLPKLLEAGEITGFDVHGELSPKAEEALAAFGTRNFQPLAGFTR